MSGGGSAAVAGKAVVVETGDGHDHVAVSIDEATDEWVVVVNGDERRFDSSARLVIRTGAGDDTVIVAPGTRLGVTIFGGPGDDTLRGGDGADELHGGPGDDHIDAGGGDDRVWGGPGRDYLDGGAGDDYLSGGAGNDTIYGLDGDDRIEGGAGHDYLEGGRGDDIIDGGAGNDALSGGAGDDVLRGGAGNDRLYAGPGSDTVQGGAGDDIAFVDRGDVVADVERVVTVVLRAVGGFIRIEGSAHFVTRVQADLDMLRSSPRGQAMLAALERAAADSRSVFADVPLIGRFVNQGNTLTIREYVSPSREENNSFAHSDSSPEPGRQMLIEYQPDFDNSYGGPPITVLYHELAHIYDYAHDTAAPGVHADTDNAGVPNAERVATGLPIDHDANPATPHQFDPRHPYEFTENALRDELGTPRVPRY